MCIAIGAGVYTHDHSCTIYDKARHEFQPVVFTYYPVLIFIQVSKSTIYLPGTYWISCFLLTTSAVDRVTHKEKPFTVVTGTPIVPMEKPPTH